MTIFLVRVFQAEGIVNAKVLGQCSRNFENSTSIGVAGVKGCGLGVSKGVGVSAGGEVTKNVVIYLIYILKRYFWLFCGK